VLIRLSVKPSSSVQFLALGEGGFPVSLFPGPSSPRVALREAFPECNWHPGKTLPPVVLIISTYNIVCLFFRPSLQLGPTCRYLSPSAPSLSHQAVHTGQRTPGAIGPSHRRGQLRLSSLLLAPASPSLLLAPVPQSLWRRGHCSGRRETCSLVGGPERQREEKGEEKWVWDGTEELGMRGIE
jgi:hypothetical protein